MQARIHPSVARLLTRDPATAAAGPSAPFQFGAQCVAVSSHVLLTAKHACFQGTTPLQLRVQRIDVDEHGRHLLREYNAQLLHHSGQMDVAVLAVLSREQHPFTPLPIAPDSCISASRGVTMPCALLAFDLARDSTHMENLLGASSSKRLTPSLVERLSPHPRIVINRIESVDPMLRHTKARAKQRDSRQEKESPVFLVARSGYGNEKGISGGAVVGVDAQGRLQLLGVHVSNEFLGPSEELLMHESSKSSSDASFVVGDSDEESEEMEDAEQDTAADAAELAALLADARAPLQQLLTDDGASSAAAPGVVASAGGKAAASASSAVAAAAAAAAAAPLPPRPVAQGSRKASLSSGSDSSVSQSSDPAVSKSSRATVAAVAARVQHLAGVQGRSLFVVAHSAFTARGWTLEALHTAAAAAAYTEQHAQQATPQADRSYSLRRAFHQHESLRSRAVTVTTAFTTRSEQLQHLLYDA